MGNLFGKESTRDGGTKVFSKSENGSINDLVPKKWRKYEQELNLQLFTGLGYPRT